MRTLTFILLAFLTATDAGAEQTLVFFRHAEKPAAGNGQITCQGFNRSLALVEVLRSRFGVPDYLYAPNPSGKINDPAGSFYYIRPLATIEPIAIKLARSVNTNYVYNDINGIRNILIRSTKADSTIFIAWEHQYLVKVVQDIMNRYGGGATVPAWTSGDYDALYIVRVNYTSTGITARFERDFQGLNGQPTTCPY